MLYNIILFGRAVFWGLYLLGVLFAVIAILSAMFSFSSSEPVKEQKPAPDTEFEKNLKKLDKFIRFVVSKFKFYFYKTIAFICSAVKPFIELPFLHIQMNLKKFKTAFYWLISLNLIIPLILLARVGFGPQPFFVWSVYAFTIFLFITAPVYIISVLSFKLFRFVVELD